LPFAGWLCARFSCSPAVSVLVPALQQALLLTQSKHKGVKTNLPSPPILESAPLLYPSSSPDGTGSMMLSALANRNGCPSRTRKNKGFDLPYRLQGVLQRILSFPGSHSFPANLGAPGSPPPVTRPLHASTSRPLPRSLHSTTAPSPRLLLLSFRCRQPPTLRRHQGLLASGLPAKIRRPGKGRGGG
jgi:hypothetical protein